MSDASKLAIGSVVPFDFGGLRVRVILRDGEPWWVAADVCAVLEIVNVSDALSRLDEHDIGQAEVVDSAGRRNPNARIVNESGLYELVIRSDKPAARPFRRWVTSEVLPAIRKTGSYAIAPRDDLDVVQGMIDAIRADRQRIAAVEDRQGIVESQLAGVIGRLDHWTALGYAKRNSLPTDTGFLQRLGRQASAIMRERGFERPERDDQRYGSVGSYPIDVLDAAVERLAA